MQELMTQENYLLDNELHDYGILSINLLIKRTLLATFNTDYKCFPNKTILYGSVLVPNKIK